MKCFAHPIYTTCRDSFPVVPLHSLFSGSLRRFEDLDPPRPMSRPRVRSQHVSVTGPRRMCRRWCHNRLPPRSPPRKCCCTRRWSARTAAQIYSRCCCLIGWLKTKTRELPGNGTGDPDDHETGSGESPARIDLPVVFRAYISVLNFERPCNVQVSQGTVRSAYSYTSFMCDIYDIYDFATTLLSHVVVADAYRV